ncbi:hypothetical protein PPYR_07552 [Photinus pyralis]|uniref:PiggyBac transposable element-derived protein domain-containing protein n=1 Tax=Photinus pyralis TaxID=7054 RepID=A0A5N4AQP2_PHOPY|nr:hypothetical protein PPYR_07552 [Photinus pyralis]
MRHGFSLQEALDMVFEDTNNDSDPLIFISPPDAAVETDEDSANEDDGGLIDNLSRRQLSAVAEIRWNGKDDNEIGNQRTQEPEIPEKKNPTPKKRKSKIRKKCHDDSEIDSHPTEVLTRLEKTKSPPKKRKSKGRTKTTWIDGNITMQKDFPIPDYSAFQDKSPVDLFELMLSEDILLLILEESKKYALFLNLPDPKISMSELKCFIGILIATGYNILPGKDFYWDSGDDMGNQMIKNACRRDRFRQIMRFLHLADNTQMNPNDKLWKLRPLIDRLQRNFLKYYKPTQHMNYDESMVKYYGRHSCKQFIRGKPIRFGYKVWCLNSENGYLINFDIYQGASPNSNEYYDQEFGKATAPLVIMLDGLPQKQLPYQIYVDNLFTSFKLLTHLGERGYGTTGTIRENRVPSDCPLTNKNSMSKKKRGEYEGKISKEEGIIDGSMGG